LIDELLKKAGLKYEDLSVVEKETFNTWMEALKKGKISMKRLKSILPQ